MRRGVLLLLVLLFTQFAYAAPKVLKPQLQLLKLDSIKTVEQQGEQLYIELTVFLPKQKARHYRIPQFPTRWSSKRLEEIKNVTIWDNELAEGQAVTLILSLVEQNMPPWYTDDLIGSVRVRLKNNDGELETSWSMPNRVDAPISVLSQRGRTEKFRLLGENSNYDLYLLLKLLP